MKYMIAYLIKGPAEKYQANLMKEVSSKFNILNPNEKISPHLTLKSPFELNNLESLENHLEKFCKRNTFSNIGLRGVKSFDDKVIYLNYVFSDEAKKVFKKFILSISNIEEISLNDYDLMNNNFHATICYPKSRNEFHNIWSYLSNRNPFYNLKFDNVSILKKIKNKWVLYKEFKLK